MNQLFKLSTLTDIRFWIIVSFIVRMYGITYPPLEVGHNWRQTDGLMIARNFYEHNANILYPTVDVGGDKTGIVGSEFPILNYLIYLLSVVFGYHDWFGRLIVLIASSFGVYYFHRVIKKYFGESPSFNATIILIVSLWFSYSRKNIPDVFAASLAIIALYYATEFIEKGRFGHLISYFVLALLACLSKILAAVILTVLILVVLDRRNLMSRKVWFVISAIVILIAVCGWYFIWVPHLNTTYGLSDHFFMGMSFSDGITAITSNWPTVLKRFYDTPLKYTGFAAFLFSFYPIIRKQNWLALGCFLLPFTSFLVLLVKTGASIMGDHYYILTAIPAMAFLAGVGLSYIENKKIVIMILVVVAAEGVGNQIRSFRIREPFKSLSTLETILDGFSDRNDRVVINADINNPTAMYCSHRKGWVIPNDQLSNPQVMEDIRGKGCKYAIIVKQLYGDLKLEFPIAYDSPYFTIYNLGK